MNSTDSHNSTMPTDEWEQQFADLARRSHLVRLPSELRQSLVAQFKADRRASRGSLLSRIVEVVGTLSFDSAVGPQLAGARSTLSAENRQLIYTTDAGDIALDFEGNDSVVNISGQLYIDQLDGEQLIQLVQNDHAVADVVTDAMGEFQFADVPQGTYDIYAVSHAFELHLTGVPVQL